MAKTYLCPYSKTESIRCNLQTPCIECKVFLPDTMDKILTSYNKQSMPFCALPDHCDMQSAVYLCNCESICKHKRHTL
jgi:hypothetical protein